MEVANMLQWTIGEGSAHIVSWATHMFLVWLLGLSLGWLLPRPRWFRRVLKTKAVFISTPPLMWAGRVALALNGALVVREVWYNFCPPGTFRGFVSRTWASIRAGKQHTTEEENEASGSGTAFSGFSGPDKLGWYVTTDDLQTLLDVTERNATGPGMSSWESVCSKQWQGCTYDSWRRTLPSGKTEYKSVTISLDTAPQEFMDFYLDDDTRPKWDGMITQHELLEQGPAAHRCQVVRWERSFPFAFISKREYVIARRVFKAPNGDMFCVTKGIEHPAAPKQQGVVRMNNFYSMWRCRAVPCPQGSGRPACETTLLHFEDFQIPENLARFAVRHGMPSFVSKMVPYVQVFVKERRMRCQPDQEDPAAYGANIKVLPRTTSLVSSSSRSSSIRDGASMDDSASEASGRMPRPPSMRRLGYMLLASGVAIAIGRTNSSGALCATSNSNGDKAGSNRHSPRNKHHHRSLESDLHSVRSHKIAHHRHTPPGGHLHRHKRFGPNAAPVKGQTGRLGATDEL